MLFDCPGCGALNGVPLSMIEAGGHLLTCRRCKEAFRVFRPKDPVDVETMRAPLTTREGPRAEPTAVLGAKPASSTVPSTAALAALANDAVRDPTPGTSSARAETVPEASVAALAGGEPLPGFADRQTDPPPAQKDRATDPPPLPKARVTDPPQRLATSPFDLGSLGGSAALVGRPSERERATDPPEPPRSFPPEHITDRHDAPGRPPPDIDPEPVTAERPLPPTAAEEGLDPELDDTRQFPRNVSAADVVELTSGTASRPSSNEPVPLPPSAMRGSKAPSGGIGPIGASRSPSGVLPAGGSKSPSGGLAPIGGSKSPSGGFAPVGGSKSSSGSLPPHGSSKPSAAPPGAQGVSPPGAHGASKPSAAPPGAHGASKPSGAPPGTYGSSKPSGAPPGAHGSSKPSAAPPGASRSPGSLAGARASSGLHAAQGSGAPRASKSPSGLVPIGGGATLDAAPLPGGGAISDGASALTAPIGPHGGAQASANASADGIIRAPSSPESGPPTQRLEASNPATRAAEGRSSSRTAEDHGSSRPVSRVPSRVSPRGVSRALSVGRSQLQPSLARRVAAVPLAARVGIVVFPIAFGLALLFNPDARESEAPISIPAAAVTAPALPPPAARAAVKPPPLPEDRAGVLVAPAPDPAEHAPGRTRAEALSRALDDEEGSIDGEDANPKDETDRPDDSPAPEGWAYVRLDQTRVTARAGAKDAVAKLPVGKLVRTLEEVEDHVLVFVPPRGPAGFVPSSALASKKPIALIAREIGFSDRCIEPDLERCLAVGRELLERCSDRCGAPDNRTATGADDPATRCAEACQLAYSDCERSCERARPTRPLRKRR